MPTFHTLHEAAADGTLADVAVLPAAGADPDALGDNGVTPLHPAVGTLEAAIGRSPDGFADPGGGVLLELAPPEPVRFVDTRVRMLLAAGADTKVRDDFGKMPFDYIKGKERWKETDLYRRLRS